MTTVVWYIAAIVLLLVLLQALEQPLRLGLKLIGHGVVGGAVLWVLNLAWGSLGFHIGLNPISAMVVGVLGLPGLASLGVIHLLVR